MDGSLKYWFNGLPVNIIDDNLSLRYWFCGLPYSFSEPAGAVAETDEQRFYFFI